MQQPQEMIDNKDNNQDHSKQFQEKCPHGGHQQRHGKKERSCKFCGKLFRSKWHLTSHTRIHIGDKPYRCEICGRSFAENSSLKRHHKTHTGEKPFSCEICGKSFARNSTLKRHHGRHKKKQFMQTV